MTARPTTPRRPLRIGLIASARHAIREPYAGGLEAHTAMLARGLRERGHDVVVFASAESDADLGVEPVCAKASQLDLSRAARQDASMLSEAFMVEHHAYLQLMLDLRERDFDVLQNSSLHYLPPAMASAVPAPMVTTLHTPPTPWMESALRTAEGDVGRFVAVSETTAAAWRHAVRGCAVIPNAVDTDVWRPAPDGEVLERAVWMGRIVPSKGLHLALRAAHAAGLDVDVAGPVDDRRYFEDEVLPELRDGDRLLGHLDARALAAVVARRAVCLVTPCWDEPFGLVTIEALACGTPVAGFARGALPELLDDGLGALAPAGDVPALTAAIGRARDVDRSHCREQAGARWSIGAMVDGYEAAYAAC